MLQPKQAPVGCWGIGRFEGRVALFFELPPSPHEAVKQDQARRCALQATGRRFSSEASSSGWVRGVGFRFRVDLRWQASLGSRNFHPSCLAALLRPLFVAVSGQPTTVSLPQLIQDSK
jgi:hypothetical protein